MKIIPWLLPPLLVTTTPGFAEGISTDGSLGAAHTLTGSSITIPQELGKTVANNLFHSFSDFNINTGQTVTFSGSDSLQNVISRVTGNNPSIIDGLLKSDIKNADFYFINPHGVTFNTNAQVDVPAAFHVSTADKMDFGKNGGVFYADLSKDSLLSSEPPSAFGFLGNTTDGNGLVDINNAHLTLNDGKTFDVVSGGISIEGKGDVSPNIGIAKGQIHLTALKSAGIIGLNHNFENMSPLSTMDGGDINIDIGYIDTTGDGAGRIDIFGSNIQLNNGAVIKSDNNGDTNPSQLNGVNIKATNLYMSGSTISSSAINPIDDNGNPIFIAKGNAGNITISANNAIKLIATTKNIGNESPNILLSEMKSNTESDGNAGIIDIVTKEFELLASILSSRFEAVYISDKPILTHGILGEVNINASDYIKIHGVPEINSSRISANTITLMTKYLDLNGGGIYSSREDELIGRDKDGTEWWGISSLRNGKPGDIKIFASESILMNSIITDMGTFRSIISSFTSNNENAGNIYIKTKQMTLIDSGISSSAFSPSQYTLNPTNGSFYETGQIVTNGKAGLIEIDASEYLKLNSKLGIRFSQSLINAGTSTDGDGGMIRINTKNLELTDSSISSRVDSIFFNDINEVLSGKEASFSIERSNRGNAGDIMINADNIFVSASSSLDELSFSPGIISSTYSTFGAAGEVNLVANKISVYDAEISSASKGDISSGKTGDINIKTQNLIMEGGKITIENDALVSDSNKIGNVNLEANNVSMSDAQITSASTENVPSGNINIDVFNALDMKNNSFINTTSNAANGGHINFHGGEVTYLKDSGFITTVNGGLGNGGDISANTKVLVMDTGIIQANAVNGNGGSIQLALEALIPSRNSLIQGGQPIVWNTSPTNINLIQAASEHGVSGIVNNSAPQLNLSGVLANVTNASMDNSLISQDYCAQGKGSSLSKKGKGALPMRPHNLQSF